MYYYMYGWLLFFFITKKYQQYLHSSFKYEYYRLSFFMKKAKAPYRI